MKYSKVIVALVIGLNFWFTYRVLEIFEMTGQEPMALIGAWFAFTTGELWLLSSITKKKVDKEVKEDDEISNDTLG